MTCRYNQSQHLEDSKQDGVPYKISVFVRVPSLFRLQGICVDGEPVTRRRSPALHQVNEVIFPKIEMKCP